MTHISGGRWRAQFVVSRKKEKVCREKVGNGLGYRQKASGHKVSVSRAMKHEGRKQANQKAMVNWQ